MFLNHDFANKSDLGLLHLIDFFPIEEYVVRAPCFEESTFNETLRVVLVTKILSST